MRTDGRRVAVDALPSYRQLPRATAGGRSGWGLFGEEDSSGLMNLLTPDRARRAAGLVREGRVFPLDLPVTFFDPPLFERSAVRVDPLLRRGGRGLDEVYDGFNPQSSSQWDSLAHVAYGEDEFYNGATLYAVLHGGRNTIEHWARRGIVARGVLLDLQRTADARGCPYEPGTSHGFTVADLEAAREAAGVEFSPGDVILLRTGFPAWYAALSRAEKHAMAQRANLRACGVEHTEAMAEYLWDTHACAVASDCPAVEVWPPDPRPETFPFNFLHQVLIGLFGLALGELWWLDDLAADCARDGVHEFLLTSAPLHTPGGIGSTANALAVK